jgi:small subunit ribosomal protein S17
MQGKRKIRQGRVVSNKMDKTVVVAVETFRHHPIYGKTVRRVSRYKAHDAANECAMGDTVRLEETRPLSRDKRWRVFEIVLKAEQIEVKPQEIETPLQATEAEEETSAEE